MYKVIKWEKNAKSNRKMVKTLKIDSPKKMNEIVSNTKLSILKCKFPF